MLFVSLKFDCKEGLVLLLKHNLHRLSERSDHIAEVFLAHKVVAWLYCHLFRRLDPGDITSVGSFKDGVNNKVVDVHELLN